MTFQLPFLGILWNNCTFLCVPSWWPIPCLSTGVKFSKDMKKSLIPSHVFRAEIAGQDPGLVEFWLDCWGLTNDDVVLIGVETHSHGPGLKLHDYENRQSDFSQTSIPGVLLETGSVHSEEMVEIGSYNKEL